MQEDKWYTVRCVFQFKSLDKLSPYTYEERMILVNSESFEEAIAKAENEAEGYSKKEDCVFTGHVDIYELFEKPLAGKECFSQMRNSSLGMDDYLDRFYTTGDEKVKVLNSKTILEELMTSKRILENELSIIQNKINNLLEQEKISRK